MAAMSLRCDIAMYKPVLVSIVLCNKKIKLSIITILNFIFHLRKIMRFIFTRLIECSIITYVCLKVRIRNSSAVIRLVTIWVVRTYALNPDKLSRMFYCWLSNGWQSLCCNWKQCQACFGKMLIRVWFLGIGVHFSRTYIPDNPYNFKEYKNSSSKARPHQRPLHHHHISGTHIWSNTDCKVIITVKLMRTHESLNLSLRGNLNSFWIPDSRCESVVSLLPVTGWVWEGVLCYPPGCPAAWGPQAAWREATPGPACKETPGWASEPALAPLVWRLPEEQRDGAGEGEGSGDRRWKGAKKKGK